MNSKLGERVPLIEMQRKGEALELRAGFKGAEVASEEIDADAPKDCKFKCSVSAEYLADALKAWPDDAYLSVQQDREEGPVLFWCKDFPDMLHLVAQSR